MIESLLQLKDKIIIFSNNVIKFSVIHIYLNIFFKFADKNHWKVNKKCAEMYKSFLKIFIQLLFKYFKFINDYKIQKAVF